MVEREPYLDRLASGADGGGQLQPIGTAARIEAAYKRFAGLPRHLDQEIVNLRTRLERGYSAPRGNVRAVIWQVDAMLRAPTSASPFVTTAADCLPASGGL